MRKWLILLSGLMTLLLFTGAVRARPYRGENGEFLLTHADGDFLDPDSNMIAATGYSPAAVEFVKGEEGLSLNAYPDAGGWSIGYGHYLGETKTIDKITRDQAETYLLMDMDNAAQLVHDNVSVPLTQNQFDALISFLYNLGSRALTGADGTPTTWLRLLNSGDYTGAIAQLSRWTFAEGRANTVLAQRRAREQALFNA